MTSKTFFQRFISSYKLGFYVSAIPFLALIIILVMPMQVAGAVPSTTVVYDALPSPLPPNVVSLGYQATSTYEFGDYIHLAGTGRILRTVTVTLSDWALYSDYLSDIRYSGDSVNWTHPITLNIYSVVAGSPNTVGTLLATVTENVSIPWRPAADPTCSNPSAWRFDASTCYSGLAFNHTFDLSSPSVVLPNDIIVGIAYNTQSYGASPLGVAGPYNSLNVGVEDGQVANVGIDDNADNVFWSSTYSGRTLGFKEDTVWTPNGTVNIQVTTAPDCTGTSDCYVDAVNGNDANGGASIADAKKTIQAGIDAVAAGGAVHVLPGNYSETATNRSVLGVNGPHQFGLFISEDKDGISIVGVDGTDIPITDYNSLLAHVETNATNNFGYSGIFVEGDDVTISGLDILDNVPGNDKTIEVIGDNFKLEHSHINVNGGGSVYFNDWQFDTVNNISHIQKYTLNHNWIDLSASVDLTSGAGLSGPASGRKITNNKFVADGYWPSISFNGSGTGVPWFVQSVGGAVITGNDFTNTSNTPDDTSAHIRARGTYDNTQFDWTSYWQDNTFNKATVTLIGAFPPFDVRTYSYTSGSYNFNNVRRIGVTIQSEVNHAVSGDTVLVKAGTYEESPLISTSLTLLGESGRNSTFIALQTAPTYLGALTINAPTVTIDGFTIVGRDGTSSIIASSNILLNTTAENVVIKNNRLRVGKADTVNTTGDDGFGVLTTYSPGSDVDNLTVTNNIFEPLNTEGTRAFYINPGVDAFVFRSNQITGRFARTAITQAKDGLVEENLVTGTGAAGSRSAGLGTWGDPDPTIYGHTVFRNNEISGVGTGVAIFETEGVTVENNSFSQIGYAVRVVPNTPLAFDLSTIHIKLNSITNSDSEGVLKDPTLSGIVDAEQNWWGSALGPTHVSNPGGNGEDVGNDVDFNPWLCSGSDTSVAIGFQPNLILSPCGPDLTITKTYIGNFTQGQTGATYTLTVTNVGNLPTSGTVTVVDTLPAELTATAISGSGWGCTLSPLTCTRSDALTAGNAYPVITLTVNVASNAPTTVTNSAAVSGGGEQNTNNNAANDVTTVNAAAGTLTIRKDAIPDDPQDFSFTGSVPIGSFSLDDDGDNSNGLSNTISFNLPPGTYSLSETVPAGWVNPVLDCTGTSESNGNVTIQANQTVTCTFVNIKLGHIIIDKVTNPSGSSQSFSFDASGGPSTYADFNLTDAAAPNNQELIPGNYTVTEGVVAGWNLTGLTCTETVNGNSTQNVVSRTTNITLDPGETVTCTFTNTQALAQGTIIIKKDTVPNDAQDFSFSGTSPIGNFLLDDDSNGSLPNQRSFVVNAGTYTVTENTTAGFTLTNLVCSDANSTEDIGIRTATIQVESGETVTCIFTNSKVNPKIAVDKQTPAIAVGGGPITYTYKVTNPGNVPLNTVSVSDDKCAVSSAHTGDTNSNNLLDPGETWTFTCTYTPSFSSYDLTNKATAKGKYGTTTYTATDTETMYPFTIKKKIYLYWENPSYWNSSYSVPYAPTNNTSFSVQVYKGSTLVGTYTISQNAPQKLWLSDGSYTFQEVNLPAGYVAVDAWFKYTTSDGHGYHYCNFDRGTHDDSNNVKEWTFRNVIKSDLAIDKTGPATARKNTTVTYTYKVTNLGPASVRPKVTDDKCSAVAYVSGDTDHDGRVDPGETWTFTCSYKVTASVGTYITNKATVSDTDQPYKWNFGGDTNTSNNKDTWTLKVVQ